MVRGAGSGPLGGADVRWVTTTSRKGWFPGVQSNAKHKVVPSRHTDR